MSQDQLTVSLGFTEEEVSAGAHICQIYSSDEEGLDSLLKFLLTGLQMGERAACFSEKVDEKLLTTFLRNHDISYHDYKQSNAMLLSDTDSIYFQNDMFDPDHMLNILAQYHQDSLNLGFTTSRLIGEMLPKVQEVPGGERLLEYESKVSLLLKKHPITTVCQYNANAFDGATIMEILKVHPQMIIRGDVVHNPFYIPPEEFLKEL